MTDISAVRRLALNFNPDQYPASHAIIRAWDNTETAEPPLTATVTVRGPNSIGVSHQGVDCSHAKALAMLPRLLGDPSVTSVEVVFTR